MEAADESGQSEVVESYTKSPLLQFDLLYSLFNDEQETSEVAQSGNRRE